MVPSLVIARPHADEYAEFYERYISRVSGEDALVVLASQWARVERALGVLSDERALHRYAPGKWSVKEVVGHLCDSERVFAYRALRFARTDPTPLAGFDEDLYVPAGKFDARPMRDLIDEWRVVRTSTLALFRSFDAAALLRRGIASDRAISVRALTWVTAGHAEHHLGVLAERYGVS